MGLLLVAAASCSPLAVAAVGPDRIVTRGRMKLSFSQSFFITVTEQSRKTLDTAALRAGAQQVGFDLAPYEKTTSMKVLRVA
jgi:hypothetical protein